MTDAPPVLRDYQFVRPMGSGASATVWHAIHRGIKPCAVKVFQTGVADETDLATLQLFRGEVRTAMSFSHGSVVQVFDAGEDNGLMWMAMEWVDGVSLHTFSRHLWKRGGKWPLPLAAYVIGRLLVALSYIHEFSIAGKRMWVVHRDVKPGNVLVSAGGEVKLTDFGIATMWTDDSTSTFRGTVRYAPADQYLDRATQRSDLFGAGAIFHELLANESFRAQADSDEKLYQLLLHTTPAEPIPSLPTPLDLLRRKLLAPIAERLESAREAHEILMAWPHYRPGEIALGNFFCEVMGRGASSGVTMHEAPMVPESPLPLRYRRNDTYELGPLGAPDPDAPDAYRRRRLTEVLAPPDAGADADLQRLATRAVELESRPDAEEILIGPRPPSDTDEIRVTRFISKRKPVDEGDKTVDLEPKK